MRLYKKILIIFFTLTAIISISKKFGANQKFPDSYELIWEMRPEPFISLLWNASYQGKRRYETSHFINIFALWGMVYNKSIKKIKIMMHSNIPINLSYAQELYKVIQFLIESGKEVEIWADNIDGLAQFIVFISGSKRYLTSQDGQILLHGFGISSYFQKGRLNKKKIDFIGFQSGDYKGGLAPNASDGFDFYMAANRRELLDDLVMQAKFLILKNLANKFKPREISMNEVEGYLKKGYFNAQEALEYGFINAIKIFPGNKNSAIEQLKNRKTVESNIQMKEYIYELGNRSRYSNNKAYIISLNFPLIGPITRIYGKIIRNLANDPKIKVIVLYISSPGGSIDSINEIAQAIEIARDNGKYIIAFVDSLAASGGYILACCADKIICSPGSIIGSIGSYIAFYNYDRFLKNKGIEIDRIYTHHIEDMPDDLYKTFLQNQTKFGHENFKNFVKKARKLTQQEIDDAGSGQIYSGCAAYEINLVDNIQGYNNLFELIFSLFNFQPFQFVFIPNLNIIKQLMEEEI